MAPKRILLVISLVSLVHCENKTMNHTNQTSKEETSSLRRGREIRSYIGLFTCAMKYDVSCFVDAAEDYLEVRRIELLAEADAEVLQSTSRSDPDSRPSHVANTLGRLISELTNIFENGISGYFKEAREATDDDEGDELETVTTNDSNGVSEMREIGSTKKKKKKKPLKSLIRLIKVAIIALIIVLKLAILLKVLQTAMQFKFLLISLGSFAIQAAKLWMSVRSKKEHGHEDIVYKNPYSSTDEYAGPGNVPYNGEYTAARSAQELAYSL